MVEKEMTLEEVAERFNMTPKSMRAFLYRIGFAAIRGRGTLLFTEADYLAIREARRQCSRSSRRDKDIPPITGSAGPSRPASDRDISMRLQALRMRSVQKKSASGARTRSSTSSSTEKSQVIPLKRRQ
jgi:hypothetical protein